MNSFYFEKVKRVQTLAEIGLEFSENTFDRERYEELRQISLEILEKMTDTPIEKIIPVIEEKDGYKTPKVDVRAVVFNETGKILLVQEKADNCWAMPGGWSDVSYSPKEVAEKECMEEAGLAVKATRLLAVIDKQKQGMPPAFEYVYKIFLLCEKLGDNISTGSETKDVGWFAENELPELSNPRNNITVLKMMFEFYKGERNEAYFD
ncbi:NUDIX domain-containing protein [Maribellus comscasis]|uniref:NUDIX domain-containing protein n=1 Tax=Maribellus comscasis TaxID=2681766 RepID=A0A6I6JZ99_9BACT|nr:NUDIX hydrolase N-terminal domain-containing protein [Maribellus comscasis]QGY46619.1 NUDIX domain-containing protein [Maribellus comscasis]